MGLLTERRIVTVLRWTARIIGVAIFILIVALAVGEGVPNPLSMSVQEDLIGLAFLTMTVGLLVGWKWEGLGGLLIIGGFGLFAIVNRPFRVNAVIVTWVVTGLLYLVCWWRSSIGQMTSKT